ncbi:hypothetical protein N7491_006649 [Penicillium cf. griseofulvum]|nr:hypothetical protein N7491_006649 [Penicillium cf. griseofulvum]
MPPPCSSLEFPAAEQSETKPTSTFYLTLLLYGRPYDNGNPSNMLVAPDYTAFSFLDVWNQPYLRQPCLGLPESELRAFYTADGYSVIILR